MEKKQWERNIVVASSIRREGWVRERLKEGGVSDEEASAVAFLSYK